MEHRKNYPTDVSDEEWLFLAPYLTLMKEDAPQRHHDLRDVLDALRWIVKTGSPWRYLPGDFPPWEAVYQQSRRWLDAGVFEAVTHDLRARARLAKDDKVLQNTPESGARAGYDGYKRKHSSKIHAAVDTLGNLLALTVTPANEQERAQVRDLTRRVQEVTGQHVEVAFVDQGYTGKDAHQAAQEQGVDLLVVKREEAKRGFVLLPRRWVVERSFASASRFRRLARDFERLPGVLAGLHFVAFSIPLLKRVLPTLTLPGSA